MGKMDEEDKEFRVTEIAIYNAITALEMAFPNADGRVTVAVLLRLAADVSVNHLGMTHEGFAALAKASAVMVSPPAAKH